MNNKKKRYECRNIRNRSWLRESQETMPSGVQKHNRFVSLPETTESQFGGYRCEEYL